MMRIQKIAAAALLLASTAITPASAFQSRAVHFDGATKVVQYGPTPDQVQTGIGFDANVVTSTTQIFNVEYNSDTVSLHGLGEYALLFESQFFDQNRTVPGIWIALMNDPDLTGLISFYVTMCSDAYCTNWMVAEENNVLPTGVGWVNLKIYTNPTTGWADYTINGVSSGGGPPGIASPFWSYLESSGPFQMPVAGMIWQVGCDNTASADGIYPNINDYETCLSADIAQLFFYSGPAPVPFVPWVDQAFYEVQGQLVRAHDIGRGFGIFGDLPTVLLDGGPPSEAYAGFTNSNADLFAMQQTDPAIYPWVVEGLWNWDWSYQGGELQPTPTDPYQ